MFKINLIFLVIWIVPKKTNLSKLKINKMIAKLTGVIDSIYDDKCIIDVNGVGYLVFVSEKTLDFLKQLPKDKKTSLVVVTVFKQDSAELFGFANEIEKTWFLQFNKVQGVGSKMAQKILGSYSVEEICQALIKSNSKFFTQISGVGPKLATRIVTEMKGVPNKLGFSNLILSEDNNDNNFNISNDQIINDAISALENLGYKKHDCQKILQNIVKNDTNITLENLITKALRDINNKKFG